MSDSSARGMVREWLERAEDAKKDAEVDEEFEEGNSAKSYWIGNCADELAAKLDELEQLVATWHRIANQCQEAGDVSPVAIIKADIVRRRAMEIEAWLGKKEGQ